MSDNDRFPLAHELKTLPAAWDAVNRGEKTFEVRKNDRFFQRGDLVLLLRFPDPGAPRVIRKRIGWMLQGGQFGIASGYCVFALEDDEDGK